jgi:AraC-like DNA-binding protein
MHHKEARSGGVGLERSCEPAGSSRIASVRPGGGVELFRAWFDGAAYRRHRHDTYAIGVTDRGVQVFDYRGARRTALAGDVVALYPDEAHDGRAGTPEGFGYRIVYVEPGRLAAALHTLAGRRRPLPFLPNPVSSSGRLARAIEAAFAHPIEPLAADTLVLELATGLLAAERGAGEPAATARIDVAAVERARRFLDSERTRVVRSGELETITGLTRYDLARQFRTAFGTSPYRYLLMRRLDFARERMDARRPLAEVACEAGFADQAHFTRVFTAAFGLSPGRYRALGAGASRSSTIASRRAPNAAREKFSAT